MRLALIVAAVGSLAFAATPALGASHAFTTTIAGSGASALSGPTDVAVEQTTHDVYVTDPGNARVEKFDSAGNFILMFGKNVNSGTGNPNVCTNAGAPTDICQPGTQDSTPGAFTTPTFLAVDNSGGPSNGDVHVGDLGTQLVQKFDASGHIISTWGVAGQQDGSGTPYANSGWAAFGGIAGIDVGPTGTLYVLVSGTNGVLEYAQDGTFLDYAFAVVNGMSAGGFKLDSAGNFYPAPSQIFKSVPESHGGVGIGPLTSDFPTTGFAFDPAIGDLYQDTGAVIDHYSETCNPANGVCHPLDSFGSGDLFGSAGVGVDSASHAVYVANSASNDVAVFADIRPIVTTGAPTNVTDSSVTLTGHIDPAGRGGITACHFEYGFDNSYGATVPCTPDPASSNFTGPTDVTATATGLSPGTRDHYRLLATNAAGSTSSGKDQTFVTNAPPSIDALAATNLTATSADINAQVNPNGLDTTYHVEYGLTSAYGQVAPIPDGTISASNSNQPVSLHLANLTPHVVYHYRLLATNAVGTTASVDHTFNFFPPSCPNENVRQQTQANYLPDCRAYELVSPGDAGGTLLYPGGPNTGLATNPSRFSFVGQWGSIPNSGSSPMDSFGDLYVATRTDTGWVSRYVGLPANQAAVDGGPPEGLPGSAPGPGGLGAADPGNLANGGNWPDKIQNGVLTDPSMDTFLDFNDGNPSVGSIFIFDYRNPTPTASNAPYVFSADGSLRDRWPTNLGAVPDGVYPDALQAYTNAQFTSDAQPLHTAPGGVGALNCLFVLPSNAGDSTRLTTNYCPGDVTASADLTHFVFATEWNAFAPGGQLSPPGSVYDNDTAAATVSVASKTPAGDAIPSEPTDQAGDPLQIPAVSRDGSHILIAAGGTGPCGLSRCPIPCEYGYSVKRCPMQPSHLYMRVDGAVTYDVSKGHDVQYVGATDNGSKVYFTTDQQLTPDDTDTSTDLYMWSEAGDSITLVSKGTGGAGNSDACNADFTAKCGVVAYSSSSYCQLRSGVGGNCRSDNSIASQSGDVYFFSPEQLDGSRGIANRENLYDYHDGQVRYVAAFTTGSSCAYDDFVGQDCSDTPIVRMQVSPDGSHMAFVTASPVTQYDNTGHLEMYTYEPATGNVVCVSCIPSGAPPTSDVTASQDGLFMTDDGRTAFATDDALVPNDTNQAQDVYEYVDGHPQLITPGTGDTRHAAGPTVLHLPGLVGVSADGRDIYFSTYDTLVSQDHNGLFLKFYDARSGGGFSAPPPPPGCTAADECHGAGSSAPAAPAIESGANLGSAGNASPTVNRHRRKKHHKRRHTRATKAHRGGAK